MNKSFKERVTKFWQAFATEEAEVRSMMDNKVAGETLLDFVNNILSIAFNEIYFEMGINEEGKYELILTPEGDKAKLFQLHYWLSMAPPVVWEKWNFYSSKPGNSGFSHQLTMYDLTLHNDDVPIYYSVDTDRRKVDVQIVSPKMMTLEEDNRYSMFFIYLDRCIGEIYTMEYIGYIDFVEEIPLLPVAYMSNFKDVISNIIADNDWARPENPKGFYSVYRLDPSESKDWKLREDVQIGGTCCIPVINSYLKHDETLFRRFEKDGVVFGFLFFDNTDVPKDSIVHFRGEIEDKIIEITEPRKIAESIGGATGVHFSYMDFIIYDRDAFLPIAKDILDGYKFEQVGYSNFVYGDKPEVL